MKKEYETPEAQKVDFNYRQQVVADSSAGHDPDCDEMWTQKRNLGYACQTKFVGYND